MNEAQAFRNLLVAFTDTLDEQATELDTVELDAIVICDFIGAAEAKGAASAFRVVANGLRENTSGPGVELAHSPTCEVPPGPGDGLDKCWCASADREIDLTPADLHDDWTEVLA